jgi:hypothetical protein
MVPKAHSRQFDDETVVGTRPVRAAVEEGMLVAFAEQTVISQFFDNVRVWYPYKACEPRPDVRLNFGIEELLQSFKCSKLLPSSHVAIEAQQ